MRSPCYGVTLTFTNRNALSLFGDSYSSTADLIAIANRELLRGWSSFRQRAYVNTDAFMSRDPGAARGT